MRSALLFFAFVAVGCTSTTAPPATTSSAKVSANPAPSSSGVRAPIAIDVDALALRDRALTTSRAFDTVTSLVDDVGPRLTGSPGYRAAIAWALAKMKEMGLEDVRSEPVKAPAWERGEARAEITSPAPHELAVVALGGSPSTPDGGVEGDVIEVTTTAEADKLDAKDVKGKILFIDAPMERSKDGEGYGKAVWGRVSGGERGAKLGALAVVIRSVGTDENRLPHTGAMKHDVAVVPSAAISAPDAEMLHRLLARGPVKLKLTLGCKMIPDVDVANVIGEVKGSAKPDEIVLASAHLDSWDLAQGAIDDGAGVAIALEVGRQIALAPRRPKRTVRVVLFANEEMGLAGAKAYAKAHEAELAKHVAAMEADFGAAPVYGARFRGAPANKAIFDRAAAALARLHVEPLAGDAEGGSDLTPLLTAGVPLVDLVQDGTKYFDIHHSANDTLAQIDKREIDQAAAAFATMAFAIADDDGDLGRIPDSERARQRR